MCRDSAAGLIRLNSAFIAMTGRLRMPTWPMARWCAVVATSCRLATFAQTRCLKISFCWGRW